MYRLCSYDPCRPYKPFLAVYRFFIHSGDRCLMLVCFTGDKTVKISVVIFSLFTISSRFWTIKQSAHLAEILQCTNPLSSKTIYWQFSKPLNEKTTGGIGTLAIRIWSKKYLIATTLDTPFALGWLVFVRVIGAIVKIARTFLV